MAVATITLLAACSAEKPKPAELPPNVPLLGVRLAWSAKLPPVTFPLQVDASGDILTLASSNGTMIAIDARTGVENWRVDVGAPIEAGVGSDGSISAVVVKGNELVAVQGGKIAWRRKLTSEAYTAPLVAGRRVFVLTADRSLSAFDGQSGRPLWTQTRTPEQLVLRKGGVLVAVGNTLVYGVGGRLVGVNPADGSTRWEAPVASPRGTNDVERLVDLTGSVARDGDVLCVRAYYASIGCVDAVRGTLLWSRPAVGAEGVTADDRLVYGSEANGSVIALRRADGERAWSSDRLRYRSLSAPLAVGRSIVVGDGSGLVHVLSRDDGAPQNRLPTDGSAIVAAPVLIGNTVVVVTQSGGVFGFRPE
ncbi:MAG: outer membrane protein assembly factor BamB [Variovorax sp.]